MTVRTLICATLALTVLTACGEEDVILPGERVDIRAGQAEFFNLTRPINLPAQQANSDWTHRNGDADHQIRHPALGADLTPLFVADIGQGDTRRARITADPVVADGVIYTMDALSTVTATSAAGETLWTRSVTPRSADVADASGGGLAVGGGRVFVTSGFGELTALDAASGNKIWVQDLDAPGGSAPTVRGNLVYVVARDSMVWAIATDTGRVRWQLSGTPSTANFSGGAGPAVRSDIAVFPFPSGEVVATFPRGGLRRWSAVVSGQRPGRAATLVTDIAGDPVIDGNRVYVGNFGGQVVALKVANGDRIWSAREGLVGPVWPAGNAVFLVNDLNQLVRLNASNGEPVWRVALPNFVDSDDRQRNKVFAHYGPVLAGGRLIVASSDGLIRQFDPTSGALIETIDVPGGAASSPAVAGGTLYVVSKTGQLHAFR